MQDIESRFQQIKQEYAEYEKNLKASGKGLVYRTEKGIYGTTNIDSMFKFFREIGLQNYKSFLDLGCGDGRVVLVASLFTKATGVEYDAALLHAGEDIKRKLGLDCTLLVGDYMNQYISSYEVIFMNPDHGFGPLDQKLKDELNGVLFVYNEIFAPELLTKGKKYWAGQIPIVKYTNEIAVSE